MPETLKSLRLEIKKLEEQLAQEKAKDPIKVLRQILGIDDLEQRVEDIDSDMDNLSISR